MVKPTNRFDESVYPIIFNRLKNICNTHTQAGVARYLGIQPRSVSNAYEDKTIPNSWLKTLRDKYFINEQYVLTGRGAKFIQKNTPKDTKTRNDVSIISDTQLFINELEKRGYYIVDKDTTTCVNDIIAANEL